MIAETLLRSQEGLEGTDGANGSNGQPSTRPSSITSSEDSEPFEVIEEEPESECQPTLVDFHEQNIADCSVVVWTMDARTLT